MRIKRFMFTILVASGVLLAAVLAPQAPGVAQAPPPGQAGSSVQTATMVKTGEIRLSDPTSPETIRHGAELAYDPDHREYLVVWYNVWSPDFYDIYARRITRDGQLKSTFTIATGANGDGKTRFNPAVAYNAWANQYLVVYMYDALGDGTHWEVWGRLVAWDGSWSGPEFQILAWANRAFWKPRVVWNVVHNEYLVVANALDTVSGLWNDVAGRRVMEDGSMPYPGGAISPQSQTLQPSQADVAYCPGTDDYLVVWRGWCCGDDWDISGARLRGADASLISPPGDFLIDDKLVDQRFPTVATDRDDHFLVVWQHGDALPTTEWDVWGRDLDPTGSVPGTESFSIAFSGDNEQYPNVAIDDADGLRRFVVWRRTSFDAKQEIWGFDWIPSAELIAWLPYKIAADVEPSPPVIAEGDGAFLVVYERAESGGVHIYGRAFLPHRAFLPVVFH